ncbi:PREDICTED: uncharacterized GPI-anchored protein At4g28100 [Tarenaya hassleriana]|uniref:uncharacterized GPI-anchored protein At4g28100 n=1 Tax=Tarenaya hassleriana TaxID=28532 RepID=UPI00053C8F3D|nr:PREDICTED: uncharacterized GPI-anchored protein At4g28100 [Tarenaya hassleriana]
MSLPAPPLLALICFFTVLSPVSPHPSHNSDPDPLSVQPFRVNSSPPATIPAFPEQSDFSGCPLDLPDELLHSIASSCGGGGRRQLSRGRCCPVLGAWLYAAYSATALGRGTAGRNVSSADDLPVLPDDSETCVDGLGKAMRRRGIELARPNETCDVVSCYCGIRLHPLSCPEAFEVNEEGKLVGNDHVERLEKDCLSSDDNVDEFPGLGGCNKCLNSLYKLNPKKEPSSASNPSKEDETRTAKMHNKDCELMGLTWLLAKNRKAYIGTVTSVLRAIMLNGGSDTSAGPRSCALSSDGMPLAVDSSEFSDHSSTAAFPLHVLFFFSLSAVLLSCGHLL